MAAVSCTQVGAALLPSHDSPDRYSLLPRAGLKVWQHDTEQELGGEQAIDHAGCLGAQGSVEERIIEIIEQRKKGRQQSSSMAEGVDEDGASHRGKRRVHAQQDVAGLLKADCQNLRTAELEKLFQVTACPPQHTWTYAIELQACSMGGILPPARKA